MRKMQGTACCVAIVDSNRFLTLGKLSSFHLLVAAGVGMRAVESVISLIPLLLLFLLQGDCLLSFGGLLQS